MDLKTNSRCTSDCETCYKFESAYIFTPGESGYVVIGEIKNKDSAYCSWSMGYGFESYLLSGRESDHDSSYAPMTIQSLDLDNKKNPLQVFQGVWRI